MKTTTGDKIAFASVVVVALMAGGGWIYALAAERHAQHLMRTFYSRPTPQFAAALAASEGADIDDVHLASSRPQINSRAPLKFSFDKEGRP